jgi:RNase H-fold protein (predicted Holliday junction resolvase)
MVRDTKQYHWNMVERLAIKNEFIFIIIGGPFILPKRDFHSEENYQEFAKKLLEYWESGKNKPISADLLTDNRE